MKKMNDIAKMEMTEDRRLVLIKVQFLWKTSNEERLNNNYQGRATLTTTEEKPFKTRVLGLVPVTLCNVSMDNSLTALM